MIVINFINNNIPSSYNMQQKVNIIHSIRIKTSYAKCAERILHNGSRVPRCQPKSRAERATRITAGYAKSRFGNSVAFARLRIARAPLADLLKEIHDQIVLGKISSKEELITTYKEEILGMSPIVINEDLSLIV